MNDFNSKLQGIIQEGELSQYKAIILLPGEGCTGCISSMEAFVQKLEPKNGIKVIFTAVQSMKVLRMKLGLDLDQQHLFVDKENIFNKGRTYSIYPTVFHLKDGVIYDFDYINPTGVFNIKDLLN